MRACLGLLLFLAACDDGGAGLAPDAAADGARPADGATDAAPRPDGGARRDGGGDGALDAAPDGEPDGAVDARPAADAGPFDPFADDCPARPSPRPAGSLRVHGCRLVRDGEAEVVPRGVVVSGDSFARPARTPLHEAAQYADLAVAGFEVAWIPVFWDGIEPQPGTYNGAYLGRICEQAALAAEAGLTPVLGMHQDRFGPALGGHGFPDWATPRGLAPAPAEDGADHPSVGAAWAAFWRDEALIAAFEAAWLRLLDTCAERGGVAGLQVLGAPQPGDHDPDRIDVERLGPLTERVRAAAEARLGPLLLFVEPVRRPDGRVRWPLEAPDQIYAPAAWGDGRDPAAESSLAAIAAQALSLRSTAARLQLPLFVRSVSGRDPELAAAPLALVEVVGAGWAVWHDGYATDAYALRDREGRPTPAFAAVATRPAPLVVAGRVHGYGPSADGGWFLRWSADGSNAGLTRVRLAVEAAPAVTLTPDGPFDWFSGYDAATGELSIFVEGAAGVVEARVTAPAEGP